MRKLIRYGAYPLIVGGSAGLLIWLATHQVAYWPVFPLVMAAALLVVAVLERVQPYEPEWNRDHQDLATDLWHNLANHGLLQLTVVMLSLVRSGLPGLHLGWPLSWPLCSQVLMAGLILDFSLYAMHRWSHHQPLLWRLHAIHHSPERLYWLNAERRHPLHAVLLAGPGLVALLVLGAPATVVSCWLAILTIHLSFQHANLDYRLGPVRFLLGVAENHRWHHKREYEDAQVNFGEFWMIWDVLLGTYHQVPRRLRAGELGLRLWTFPLRYTDQLRWPFRSADPVKRA